MGFDILEDGIPHSHCREKFKPYETTSFMKHKMTSKQTTYTENIR
jgi:hypothetical protein